LFVALLLSVPVARSLATDDLADARILLDGGKYAEAEDAYRSLLQRDPLAAAVGIARCQASTGQREDAAKTLADAIEKQPEAAVLLAEAAFLALQRGDHPACKSFVDQALKHDPESVQAHGVRADLQAATGKLDAALADYSWLVDRYNNADISDRDELLWIGRGAAQFARWKRLGDQFHFLVNDFYPDLIEKSPACWQAHLETARLFAEKYNEA
jgi:thioredoxin-like negative regulator of GroEL